MPTGVPTTRAGAARNRAFGAHLRRLRERKGISLREAARRLLLSPGLVSKAERGLVDVRKPGYVDRFAAVLGVDVNDLRREAGLMTLEWQEVWSHVQDLGGDLLGLRVKDKRDQRLFKVLGFILFAESAVASTAKEPGVTGDVALAELEEILRLVVLVAERRHGGGAYQAATRTKDPATLALFAAVDSSLDQLYKVVGHEVEELLEST